ncbi:MAG: hypothetical protein K0S32_3402 [Bacteroidetes bacterium]|nr:hypothetical protein [Bacteroidota bacterium]
MTIINHIKNVKLVVVLLLSFLTAHYSTKACSPLNVPTMVGSMTVTATQLMVKWQSTTPYYCPDVIVVEIACNGAAYTGLAQYSFTSAVVTGASNPYAYPTMTMNISQLCPGSVYKFRAKEKNQSSTTSSAWSGNFTFTTQGTFVQPTLLLTASPSSVLLCPQQSSQLTASLVNGCGGSGITYSWAPGASLSCITCSNPIATPTVNTTYTCWATGGQWGCWTASNTVNVGVISVPPSPGIISASPATLCAGQNSTLTSTTYSGSLQWQSSLNPGGPFTNIAGATGGTFVTGPLNITTYYQGMVSGCGASIATNIISVGVTPMPTITVNSATICAGSVATLNANGATTYVWSAGATSTGVNTATASPPSTTVYTVTGSTNGCVSSATSAVVVNQYPVVNIGSNSPVCLGFNLNLTSSGGGTYNWNGPSGFTSAAQNPVVAPTTMASAGVYNLTVTANGCSTMTNINVAIVNPTTSASNTGPYCAGSTVQLNVGSAVSYTWSGPNGFVSNAQNPTIPNSTPAATGIYNVLVTLGTCTTQASTSVTVNALPVPVTAVNTPICETANLSLTGNGGTAYAWTGPNGFSSNQQNPVINMVTAAATGIYSLTVTDANNCVQSATINAVVNALPVITIGGSTVCIGGTGSLTATGGASYSWSGPNGFVSNSQNPTVPMSNQASAGVYNVVITGANGCSINAATSIGAYPIPTPVAANSGPVCVGKPVDFSSSGGFVYSWVGPNGFVASTSSTSIKATELAATGTYTLGVIDDKGCQGFATTYLLVRDLPKANLAASNNNGCVPFCSTFNLSSQSASLVSATWNTNGGAPFPGLTYNNCFTKDGRYVLASHFTDIYGCSNTSTFEVNAYPIPMADFHYGPGKPVEENDVNFVDASIGPQINKWSWYFINSTGGTSTLQNPTYIFHTPGNYAVTLVIANKWGCKDTITKPIQIGEDFNLYIPNVFSPNGDGSNDVFQPKGHGVIKYTMTIFDRWGEKLFVTQDFNIGWDGIINGTIEVQHVLGKTKEYVGHVSLLR